MEFTTIGRTIHPGRTLNLMCHINTNELGNECMAKRYRVLLIKDGFGVIQIDDRSQLFTAPSIVCLNEKESLEFVEENNMIYDILYFDPKVFTESTTIEDINLLEGNLHGDYWFFRPFLIRNEHYIGVSKTNLYLSKRLAQLMTFVSDEITLQKDCFWPCRSRSFFIELVLLVNMIYDHEDVCQKMTLINMTEEVKQIINYLHIHYPDKVTIEQLVSTFHTNKTTMNQKFKEVAGVTVIEYLNDLRMQIACSLLKNTFLTVNEIMERVGFKDDAHFLRSFRQYAHCSPSAYRNQQNS